MTLQTKGHVTENLVGLMRIPTPTVTSVMPTRGFYRQRQAVTVSGYGFVSTEYAACRFQTANGTVEVSLSCKPLLFPLVLPPYALLPLYPSHRAGVMAFHEQRHEIGDLNSPRLSIPTEFNCANQAKTPGIPRRAVQYSTVQCPAV